MKTCKQCQLYLEESRFNKHITTRDRLMARCKQCEYQIIVERKKKNQKFLIELLKNSECADCKTKDIRVLEFDHVRGEKKDAIANLLARGKFLVTILEEIAKCEIVCANCHRIRTYKRIPNSWRNSY